MTPENARRPGTHPAIAQKIASCGTQRLDDTDRLRRAAVQVFVDVVASARPSLTDHDLCELRSWLYERAGCAPAVGLGDALRLRRFDEVYPDGWHPGDEQAVER